jgi:hypothetical protein
MEFYKDRDLIQQNINLDRYPINDFASQRCQSLVSSSREHLESQGVLILPGFLLNDTVDNLLDEVNQLKSMGHRMSGEFSAYSDDMSAAENRALPDKHPGRLYLPAAHRFIAGDLIAESSPIRQIYHDSSFIRFIADVLGIERLHVVTDSMGCINYLIYEAGDCNGWHFDTTEFVISIPLQLSETGGCYEYIPDLRSVDNENLAVVSDRMQNPDNLHGVKSVNLEVGSLFLFKGKNTLHRVTETVGPRDRVVTILSFNQTPGHQLSKGSRLAMYGREE